MKEFHPLANIFPQVEGPEFADLVADIREHGLYDPIVMFEDRVLDGRNRLRACEVAGVEPVFTVYTGDDPAAFVVKINLHRRHLDESQRAMVAVKLATLLRAGRSAADFRSSRPRFHCAACALPRPCRGGAVAAMRGRCRTLLRAVGNSGARQFGENAGTSNGGTTSRHDEGGSPNG